MIGIVIGLVSALWLTRDAAVRRRSAGSAGLRRGARDPAERRERRHGLPGRRARVTGGPGAQESPLEDLLISCLSCSKRQAYAATKNPLQEGQELRRTLWEDLLSSCLSCSKRQAPRCDEEPSYRRARSSGEPFGRSPHLLSLLFEKTSVRCNEEPVTGGPGAQENPLGRSPHLVSLLSEKTSLRWSARLG
jgi:hypothetical protein